MATRKRNVKARQEREIPMNMRVLKKSRKVPSEGDIFALQVIDGEFLFGRVINTKTRIGNFDDVIMLYIYGERTNSKHDVPILDKRHLLVPPLGTNRQPWYKGYFETVVQRPLAIDDILEIHCFEDISPVDSRVTGYFDEQYNRLKKRTEPCGAFCLEGYRTIDAYVSQALGIPLATEW